MIPPDDHRRFKLSARHHVVERQPQPVPIAKPHPGDTRRQALIGNALLRHVEPVVQVCVVGQQFLHLRIGAGNILRVAR